MRAFLDSCLVIYLVEQVRPWVVSVSAAVAQPDVEIVVTQLVRMECRVGPLQSGDDEVDRKFGRFFRSQRTVPIRVAAFELATELRAQHRLKTPDALHIAAAITSGCDEFWTNDHRLDRVPLPLSVRVFGDD